MRGSTLLTLAASASSALAQYKGFNYGSTFTDGSSKVESDFEAEFNTAKSLVGTSGFSSARLYTMIQAGTTDTLISAIPAAISTETTLLLGMWASAGQADFDDELTALAALISQYGSQVSSLIAGISVGSEDLYRITPTGVASDAGSGAEPETLVSYISQVRSAISGTVLSNVPIGHVDTWTAWVNGSNDAVINAVDFVGMDAYPYFQNTMANDITDGASLFASAYQQTVAAAGSKDVWVTETGWPVSGPTENEGVPSTANAQTYWDAVGCDMLFGKVNTWWYTLQDAQDGTPSPSFGLVGATLSDTPLYDLTCNTTSSSSSSVSSSTVGSTSKSVASVTTPTTGAVSATTSISENPVPSASYVASTTSVVASAVASSSAAASVASSTTAKASTTVTAVTTASTTSVTGDLTLTVYQTTLITITSCSSPTVCVSSTLSTASAPASSAASVKASTTVAASSAASASSTSCPANLNGDYQYPHLIVPVSSTSPTTAYGTQYNGTINSTVSTIFNFDIPESYAGLSCSLVFLFPELSQLETSSYSFNGEGGIVSHVLSTPANSTTSYATQGSQVLENGAIASLQPGNSYVISNDVCPPGEKIGFELSSTGGLALEFFEDYNPSPLGLYVVAC